MKKTPRKQTLGVRLVCLAAIGAWALVGLEIYVAIHFILKCW